MEVFSPPQLYQGMRRYWRTRKYQRLEGSGKRNVRVARLGGGKRGSWKVRVIRRLRLRLRLRLPSPFKLLARIRDAYVDAMLRLGGKAGSLHIGSDASFGVQKVPKEKKKKQVSQSSIEDFESRLLFEIYKSIAASRQLSAIS